MHFSPFLALGSSGENQKPNAWVRCADNFECNHDFQQVTSEDSCKSFSLIGLPYLPAEKLPQERMAASTDLPVPPAATKKILP